MKRESRLYKVLDEALAIIHAHQVLGVGDERYGMFKDWYDRLDDIKLEMAGVLGFGYENPKAEE